MFEAKNGRSKQESDRELTLNKSYGKLISAICETAFPEGFSNNRLNIKKAESGWGILYRKEPGSVMDKSEIVVRKVRIESEKVLMGPAKNLGGIDMEKMELKDGDSFDAKVAESLTDEVQNAYLEQLAEMDGFNISNRFNKLNEKLRFEYFMRACLSRSDLMTGAKFSSIVEGKTGILDQMLDKGLLTKWQRMFLLLNIDRNIVTPEGFHVSEGSLSISGPLDLAFGDIDEKRNFLNKGDQKFLVTFVPQLKK